VRAVARAWWEEAEADRLAPEAQLDALADLLRAPATEDKLAAMLLLQDRLIPAGQVDWREALPRFAARFDDGSLADWSAVDWFCVRVLGPLIDASGDECAETVAAWIEAPGLWRRRASLVAFVNLVRSGRYADLVLANAARLASERERFAQTAVAWAIRELGRVDPGTAEAFLDEHRGSLTRAAMRQARGRRG
jgi:3-methyladenine DNA glycosylase AlkD